MELTLIIGLHHDYIIRSMLNLIFTSRRYDMFWTDDNNNRIWRAKLNGTQASIMISTRLNCPGWIYLMIIYVR